MIAPEISGTIQTQDFRRGRTENFYPEQRADDMGESSRHNNLRADLFLALDLFFSKRDDIFMTANMNVYYIEGNSDEWFAPDILIAFGVPNYNRSVYKTWEEQVFPQVVIEIVSDRTWKTDTKEKLKLYEQLGAEEYYILDSENGKYLSVPMLVFGRQDKKLVKKQINGDRVFSPRLDLEIVRTEKSFRFFNPQTNKLLSNLEESQAEIERLKARIKRLRKVENRLKLKIQEEKSG